MASLQEYKKKLASLKNTLKITKTMKMVSASKLKRAQTTQGNASNYADHVSNMIARLAGAVEDDAHPLMTPRPNAKKALVLVFTSDKGLCGGFNNNLIKMVNRWVQGEGNETYDSIDLSFCGRRGFSFFNGKQTIAKHYEDVTPRPNFSDASRIGAELVANFIDGTYDHVYMAYNTFQSPLSQTPSLSQLLPIQPAEVKSEDAKPTTAQNYIFEPAQEELLAELIPRIINFKVFYTLLENSAGEHGARMTAMDNATSNAEGAIEKYTLMHNRARQAAITTELIEIISGAEALN